MERSRSSEEGFRKFRGKGAVLACCILAVLSLAWADSARAVSYPFADNMETAGNWQEDAPWAATTALSHSPSTAWTDSPGGAYQNNADVSLTLASSMDLSSGTAPTLVFWHTYQFETGWDFGRAEISTDGGNTWALLASYTGASGWKREQIDLSDYGDQTDVKIRFRLVSDKSLTYDGWTIDDVSIGDPPNPLLDVQATRSVTAPSTAIDLTWTRSVDADFASYRIHRSTTSGVSAASTLVTTITNVAQTAYSDTGLAPNSTYYYKVYVYNQHDLASGSKTEASASTALARFSFPFFDDLEGPVDGWTAAAPWALVTLSASEAHGGVTSTVWTDSPDGAYAGGVDTTLQMTIDLGPAVMPVLSFSHKHALEDDHDFGYIEVKEVGTATWKRIYFLTGTSPGWQSERVDLSEYAGKEIDLRFRLTSDTNNIQSQGWFLDDVKVAETESPPLPYPFRDTMDGEATAANWHTSSWALVPDPHSGTYAMTDSPLGSYGIQVDSSLIMANSINLEDAVHPLLTFWHKYDITSYDKYSHPNDYYATEYDYGRVYLSTFNGQPGTWKQLAAFKGNQAGYTRQIIDLSAYVGLPDVRIKFVMNDNLCSNTSYNVRRAGWTIDDVAVEEAPRQVELFLNASSQSSVALSWTASTDQDFARYELYRSTSNEVTRGDTLVAQIAPASATSYTDTVAMVQPQSYYYRVWTVDVDGNISRASNVVHATYEVPSVRFPFVEDGEDGTGKWSWGAPWGLVTLSGEESYSGVASTVWTDSPGESNYGPNANTSLCTYVNLSGTLHPVLEFWNRYSLEQGKDFVRLEVSTTDGQTWTVLRTFTGTETRWNKERVDLTPYAGNARLGLRFRLTSDGDNQQDGWYMDDLTITEQAVQAPYPLFDDMEEGGSPWFYTSPWGLTTLKASEARSGVTSTVWTDSPEGPYAAAADTSLWITIDLGPAIMPVLSFWQKYTFNTNSDYGYVEVSEVGTADWKRICFVTGTAPWLYEKVDLSGYAGKQVLLRFRVVADTNGIESDGWYIDDIRIGETQTEPLAYPFRDDMEGSETAHNWHSSSWALVPDARGGNYAFTDSPEGNYGYLVDSALTMASSISLKDAVHPQLTFWHKYDMSSYDKYSHPDDYYATEYDYGRVYISSYNGQPGTWNQLAAFKGTQGTWAYRQIDLTPWAGLPNVRIKLVMNDNLCSNTSYNVVKAGWTIDEVAVEEAPVDVHLSVAASSQHRVSLSWTANVEGDFGRYEVYRSSSPGVTRSSQRIASISSQDTRTLVDDVALIEPGTYYYRMWVVDVEGNVSMGSNEVQATYTVPVNGFPFTEDGEGGTGKWSWGSPWGLTQAGAYQGSYCWTDSPGANYQPNVNTSLATYLNLSGTTHPVLTFWHRYSLEEGKDFVRIEVSTDNWQTYTLLRSITGTETAWNQERINLTAYAGNARLGLRFRLTSDGSTEQDGWYMDGLTIQEEAVQGPYPFFDDMETGVVPWFYDSPWGLKALSAEEGYSGLPSTVWTDSPGGSYASGADSSLYLNIDLGSARMPVLTFWHRYTLDTNSDHGYVEVKPGGTTGWKRIYFTTGTAPWSQEKIDLSEYAGKQLDLRFRLVADSNGVQSDGWFIDDISIAETPMPAMPYPFVDDMEGPYTVDSWHTSSWGLVPDAHSGSYALTDSPVGYYGEQVDSSLILAGTVNLKGAVHPQLSFWHKYDTSSYAKYSHPNDYYATEYDYCRVYLSTYNGQSGTWNQIASFSGSASWAQRIIDLSPWKGLPNVRIKFVMNDNLCSNTNYNVRKPGWTIDDVRIGEDRTVPAFVQKTSGDGQIGETGKSLAQPFVATVYDAESRTLAGIPVTFAITSGGGSLSVTQTASDTGGKVQSLLTLGETQGTVTVEASIDGTAEKVSFSAQGYAAATPLTIAKFSGDNQTAPVGQAIANPLVVKVADIRGDLLSDVGVTFSILSGGGSLSVTQTATTDGLASTKLTLGANPGKVMVLASAPGLTGSPITFYAHGVLPGGTLGDTDGDGMPDDWETLHGLDPLNPADASGDFDNDGLSNFQEYARGTDPKSSDTDGDGMPDGWEVQYGLDPLNAADAYEDWDGDGVFNIDEYLAGTIPVPAQHFRVARVTNNWMDFYGNVTIDGVPAERGDEVAVLDEQGTVCGQFTVTTPGQYGFMHVYLDDPASQEDEGARPGDELTFRIWDASAQTELNVAVQVVTGTQPPSWTFDGDISHVNLTGAGAQSIPLRAGWNLVSLSVKRCLYVDGVPGYDDGAPNVPLLPGTVVEKVSSIADVLASIDGKYEVVRSFDGVAHTYDPLLPEYSDLKYLAGGYGYWIKMRSAGNLEINGLRAAAADKLTLGVGWNLVGYWHPDVQYATAPPLVDFPPDAGAVQVDSLGDVVSAIEGKYAVMRTFDGKAHTYDPLLGAYNDMDYLGPGYGIWIKMKTLADLSY